METLYWLTGAAMAVAVVAWRAYSMGKCQKPLTSGDKGRVTRDEFIARVTRCDMKFDRLHTRLDEQKDDLSEIKTGVGYIKGKLDAQT